MTNNEDFKPGSLYRTKTDTVLLNLPGKMPRVVKIQSGTMLTFLELNFGYLTNKSVKFFLWDLKILYDSYETYHNIKTIFEEVVNSDEL